MATGYLRYPDIRGDEIVFCADDDLWVVASSGGRAWRLTSDHAPAKSPLFSPDGTRVAYHSQRDGGGDVYVLDRGTGAIQRLTWESVPSVLPLAWDGDDAVVVSLPEDALPQARLTKAVRLGLDGSAEKLPYGICMGLARHASGAVAINTPNGRDSAMWKRYRGGTASKLWWDTTGAGEWERVLPDHAAGCYSPCFVGDRLVFTSDLGGDLPKQEQAQVFSVGLADRELRQHTRHTTREGYVRDVRTDGTRLVYHARGFLYVMENLDAKPVRLDVDLALGDLTTTVSAREVRRWSPDFGCDGSAVEWRGAAYFLTHRAGPARALHDVPGDRVRLTTTLGDSGKVAYVVDTDGVDSVAVVDAQGGTERLLGKGKLGYVLSLVSSPKGNLLAFTSHDHRVAVLNVATGRIQTLVKHSDGEPQGLTFSPDARYLAWRAPRGEWMQGGIVAADLQQRGKIIEITPGLHDDHTPTFSRDGKYLLFISNRNFDPRYDAHAFDLSFGPSERPYIVPLRADEPIPFGPSVDGWRISEVIAAAAAEKSEKPDDEDPKKAPAKSEVACRIDADGIAQRLVPLPVPVADYSSLQAAKDGVLWLRHPGSGASLGLGRIGVEGEGPRPVLERFSFTSRKLDVIVQQADAFAVSGDGARILVRDKESVYVAPSDRAAAEGDPMKVVVDTSRLRRTLDQRAEWRQMLVETHRVMGENFWREDMDGVDWASIRDRYLPLVDRLSTKDDLVDVLWEMVAELNTGHAYVYGDPKPPTPRNAASLGARFSRNRAGNFVIDEILPGESTDPRAISPLLAPGVGARTGDVVVAVDGKPCSQAASLGELLEGSAGKVVELTLRRGRTDRRVAVVPVATPGTARLRYHAWVNARKAYVERVSGGRLGYVHVPDMGPEGWAQFHRDIHEAALHEGVIADMRYNGGGHTSQLIIERLARKVVSWQWGRWYETPWTYPSDAPRGPVVLVTNQFAGSDGDIVNAVAQATGLGPVVGDRTWGGIVGIDGRYSLVDGTAITQPRYPSWFEGAEWGIENHGVDPDILVELSPADWDAAEDIQLDVAIAEALRRLEEKPAATPPAFPPARVKRR